MKKSSLKFIKLVAAGFIFFSMTSFGITKHKPIIHYVINLETKHIVFEDIRGEYMIDNDHIDVIKAGDLDGVENDIDISNLEKGHYTLEINHLGYIYVDDIVIE